MKILFAIKSCLIDAKKGHHKVIRDTWGSDISWGHNFLNADLLFFIGGAPFEYLVGREDEVTLDVPDDYTSLPFKTKAILNYSLAQDYDYTFLADTDTYVNVKKLLLQSGFENHDYFGANGKPLGMTFPYYAPDREGNNPFIQACYPWHSGGVGYFVSRRATEFIVKETPNIWAEDLWVGQIMGPLCVTGAIGMGNIPPGLYSWHAPRGLDFEGVKKWMYRMHGGKK